jgi:two-component system, cell cycle response regulator DivK
MQQQGATTQRTILLVEDDEDTRRIYSAMLRHAGFRVIEAATGPEAVDAALDGSPDLILMDMNLPMLDGWEAARRIRGDARACGTPILAFSALIDSTADLRRESALFDGFIAKPVRPAELVRRVAAYVGLLAPVLRTADGTTRVGDEVAAAEARRLVNRARRESSERAARAGTALQ